MKAYISVAAAAALVFSLVGCGTNDSSNNTTNGSTATAVSTSVAVPTTDAEKRLINVAPYININGKDVNLSYKTVLRTGATLSGQTFGLLKDENDTALKLTDGSSYICNGQFGGSGPDHTEFINKFGKVFMITQFECQIGAIYQAELDQNSTTGELSAKNLKFISQKDYHGGWVHCAGMKTPWNSFLGSEEYEPNAADRNNTTGSIDAYFDTVAPYFGGDLTKSNPYFVGWITEVNIVDESGNDTYTKHYSMGRFAHELAYVLPDQKTAYLTDDGANDGFYMYIADTAGDLSAGTLYAAKWTQTDSTGAGKANISWIKLGHATDSEIRTIVDARPSFTDIFDSETPNADGTCPTAGFSAINALEAGTVECVKLKSGKDQEAAFLETRRYAALKGATTEFRKMEGLTYNSDANKMYTAISEISKGMLNGDATFDKAGNNDIKLSKNVCGAVYSLDLAANVTDSNNSAIDSSHVIKNMNSLIAGIPKKYDANSTYANNDCDVDAISMPDNLTYKQGANLLLIGEDTSHHQNDMIWAFDTKAGKLTDRVATTPYGSETTSVMFQDVINGFNYINFVTQHPYGESDQDKVASPDDVQSYVGYMQYGSN